MSKSASNQSNGCLVFAAALIAAFLGGTLWGPGGVIVGAIIGALVGALILGASSTGGSNVAAKLPSALLRRGAYFG